MALDYVGRAPIIINKTLTLANTWYQVTAEIRGPRKWFLKAQEATDNSFDLAFADEQTEILTNSGIGWAFDGCEIPNIWCRSSTAGTVIELCYWN
jgi:hypothetical protein